MAAKLIQFYEVAAKEFGGSGQVKLAMLTKISSAKAEEAPDSPDNIALFEKAIHQLRAG